MSRRSDMVDILKYIRGLSAEDDELDHIYESAPEHLKKIQLSFAESQVVAFLFKLAGCKSILELGTLVGFSASVMAKAMPDTTITTIEKDESNYKIALKNFQKFKINNVKPECGDALEFLENFEGYKFDGVFIDANKAAYPRYLELADKYLKKGGLIIADNTLLWGEIADDEIEKKHKNMQEALRHYNKQAYDALKYESILIPTLDGITVSIKK